MGRIRVLDDRVIDRIAAGEVVERPASVVKELLENSLDAGARAVEVELSGGGKRLVRVSDDGCGMDRDDALLALERHATSKLRDAGELESISTLGFRGEALSSIAAVSHFVLQTAQKDGAGTEVRARGGRVESVREAGLPRGTSIRVERLFFNVPARRKFLRADATELSHVVRLLTRVALARPELRLLVEHEGRRLLVTEATSDRLQRVAQIWGAEFAERQLPVDREDAGVRVSGFAGRPAASLPGRDGQHYFVNGRVVQDRVLVHAVSEAYGNTMPRGRYPGVLLFVELDPARVDVNVHPRKLEVRFRDAGRVHDAVRDAVAAALSHEAVVPSLTDLRPGAAGLAVGESSPGFRSGGPVPDLSGAVPAAAPPAPAEPHPDSAPGAGMASLLGGAAGPGGDGPRAVPLAQLRDSYIVAEDEQGLVLVDQHAAHERVLFERYLEEAEQNRVEVQRLLFPATMELTPPQRILIEEEAAEFRRLGFLVEPFGGNAIRVDGVPSLAAEVDPEVLVRELVGEAASARSAAADHPALRRRLVTSTACQSAIKVHHPLSRPAMQALLDDLYGTESPSTCPHGRPALFRLTLEEIERVFRRR